MLFNSRATRGGGRDRAIYRPLGRRSARRWKEQLILRRWWSGIHGFSDKGAELKTRRGGAALRANAFETSGNPCGAVDRGIADWRCQAQGVYGCNRCAGLVLAIHKSTLAAWHEGKTPSGSCAILPARNRISSHQSSAARPGRSCACKINVKKQL